MSTPHPKTSRRLRCLAAALLGLALLTPAASTAAPTATTRPAATNRPATPIAGLWVWQPQYVRDLAEQDELLAFCQRQGFNRLLVQIPWKKGTAQVVHPKPDDVVKAGSALNPEIDHPTEFARLIAEAARRGIVVEALDGAPYMGDKVHWPETLATVDALLKFNAALPADARFVGIHWDIEPYVRPDWKDNAARQTIMADYLQLLGDARRKLVDAGSAMTLSTDIPMWYDNKTAPDDNAIVAFNGVTKNFHEHIQDLTDYVGIMSYRQKALGSNSATSMSENELKYAEKIGKFVCPAFETIELKETPQITFFGQTAEKFTTERKALTDAWKDRPGFGGMFFHQYPTVKVLLEGK